MPDAHVWYAIAVIALVTASLRFIPFLIWNGNRKSPDIIVKLGRLLPYAIMGMLVIYCVKDISFTSVSGFLPTLIAAAIVTLIYIWKRNTLISIVAGTLAYMLLVQLVF